MSIDEILKDRASKHSIAWLVGKSFEIVGRAYPPSRYMKRAACAALAAIAFSLGANSLKAATIYVDKGAAGLDAGTSWVDAYVHLQDALSEVRGAEIADEGYLIKVAQGIYRPDMGVGKKPYDREAAFQLIDNVRIMGGFAGVFSEDPNERDVNLHETILSGDLFGNDMISENPWDYWGDTKRAENSIHVINSVENDETAVLDGFTIMSGNADGPVFGEGMEADRSLKHGAGMYIHNSSPAIIDCRFRSNSGWSGGMYCERGSPAITNCTFENNLGLGGGGMNNFESSAAIIDCIFDGNAGELGGGMQNVGGYTVLTRCVFRNNKAEHGAGIHNYRVNTLLINCNLVWNFASRGGGMTGYITDPNEAAGPDEELILENCALINNLASYGGGILNVEGSLTGINCILWYNDIGQAPRAGLTYSNIQGSSLGEGNIDDLPLFVDPGRPDPNDLSILIGGDYHLMSEGGAFDGDNSDWKIYPATSPCIDAGDPNSPVGSEPLPNGNRINMGVYGGTYQASKSTVKRQITMK